MHRAGRYQWARVTWRPCPRQQPQQRQLAPHHQSNLAAFPVCPVRTAQGASNGPGSPGGPAPGSSSSSNGGVNWLPIIIASVCVGSLVMLVCAALVLVAAARKRRRREEEEEDRAQEAVGHFAHGAAWKENVAWVQAFCYFMLPVHTSWWDDTTRAGEQSTGGIRAVHQILWISVTAQKAA